MQWLMVICLSIVGGLASWAVLSKAYDDSLLQRIGLSTVATACFLRIPFWLGDGAQANSQVVVGMAGFSVYGIGTAIKVWRAHHPQHGAPQRRASDRVP